MTPMAALVFTATFALIIWIPTFVLTARVYPPNEGKDLPNPGKISPRVIVCCCLGYDMGRYRVAQCMTAIRFVFYFETLSCQRKGIIPCFSESPFGDLQVSVVPKSADLTEDRCGFFFIKRSLNSDSIGVNTLVQPISNFIGTYFYTAHFIKGAWVTRKDNICSISRLIISLECFHKWNLRNSETRTRHTQYNIDLQSQSNSRKCRITLHTFNFNYTSALLWY